MTQRARTTNDTASNTGHTGVATSREVADYLGVTEVSLAGLRYKNSGPPYIRTPGGRSIRYLWQDVDAWLDAGRVQTDNSRQA